MNLKLIKDHPVDYLKRIPPAAAEYYMSYSPYWTTFYNARHLTGRGILPRIYNSIFQAFQRLYGSVWILILLVLVLPACLLFFVREDRPALHLLLLVEAAIHYNFLISVFSTSAGVNNMRYRVPVEPLIFLAYLAALFLISRTLVKRLRKAR